MSAATDNLNPAFPTRTTGIVATDGSWLRDVAPGMTLRDWFAGQALTSYLKWGKLDADGQIIKFNDVAFDCYNMADAMLAERAKERA